MPNRIKDLTTTATTAAGDDYFVIDGATNGTRRILASNVGGGGGGAVTSVAGRTGAVTLTTADIGGLGTIATQSASSVAITGGTVSGLASLGVASGTITASAPGVDVTQTWNNAGVTFAGIRSNVVDTASATGSSLIDLQVGGASRFKVTKAGTITLLDTYNISVGGGSYLFSHTIGVTGWLVVKNFSAQFEGANLGVQMGLTGAMDVALMRNSAGVLEVNSATIGTYRDLILRNLTASGTLTMSALTASTVVGLDASKNLVSIATIGVANGGTGASSFAAGNVILGNGTSAFQVVAPGASGNVLTSNGTTWTSAAPTGGGGGGAGTASLVVPTGTINGTNTAFTLPDSPTGDVVVFLNGLQVAETGYSLSGSTLTMSVAPLTGDRLEVLFGVLLASVQKKITFGTADPTGGVDGDIYLKHS